MKLLSGVRLIVFCLLALLACKNKTKPNNDITDSLNQSKGSSRVVRSIPGAGLSASDKAFVEAVASEGTTELSAGNLALEKTTYISIRKLAKMMIAYYVKNDEQLAAICRFKNVKFLNKSDTLHIRRIEILRKLKNTKFDEAYLDLMVEGAQKVLSLYKAEAQSGSAAVLKSFAEKNVPFAEHHLGDIRKVRHAITKDIKRGFRY